MPVHVRDATGWRAPFVYPQVLEDRIMRRFRDDTSRPTPLTWFANGHIVSIPDDRGPLLLLGADSLGRDVFSRLLDGTSRSLGVAVAGTFGAILLGGLVGAIAGSRGGRIERLLMLAADFIVVLPGAYLVLVLRGLLPLTLEPRTIFVLMTALFAVSAWPHVARGVRAVVAAERTRDYAEAARASGAGPLRVARHLLPAARGFLAVEMVLLVPALLVAEATVSVLRAGVCRACRELGHDAPGRGQRHDDGGRAVAARTGRRDLRRGPVAQPAERPAHGACALRGRGPYFIPLVNSVHGCVFMSRSRPRAQPNCG